MTDLIACLSTGKGTWGHVNRLIQDGKWNKIFLITNEFGKENFAHDDKTEFMLIDSRKGIIELRDDIYNNLKGKITDEAALNLVSGTGKEHMAILSAALKLGIGIRFIALTKEGIKEL